MDTNGKKRKGRPVLIEGGSGVLAAHVPIQHKTILMAEAAEKHWSVGELLRSVIAQYVISKPEFALHKAERNS